VRISREASFLIYTRQASALYFSVIAGLDPAIQLGELNQLFKMDARVARMTSQ
jgi:hypothetical protein